MLVYLAIVGLLYGVNARMIPPDVEESIYHKDRQARQACFDRVDPRTGVSDCPSKKSLCTNPAYQRVLSEQCPLTCGKCPGVLPDPGELICFKAGSCTGKCFDRVDPRTGVSNCNKALCTNPAYKKVMEEQCPLTCNRCPGSLPNH